MANKKRHIPAAVREQLERKQRAASTLAERQGAALGKAARARLQPLLKSAAGDRDPVIAPAVTAATWQMPAFDMSPFFDAVLRASMNQLSGRWALAPERIIAPPSIDPGKLESLKAAEPYRVAPRVPDMVEVITGWRGWTLSKCGRLEALGRDTVWPAKRALEAECNRARGIGALIPSAVPHLAPAWNCSCGVWAFKDLDRLVAAIGSSYGGVRVIGTVSLWGRVIETENGYRAQYAYPAELWLLDGALEELGRIYDVPVRKVS